MKTTKGTAAKAGKSKRNKDEQDDTFSKSSRPLAQSSSSSSSNPFSSLNSADMLSQYKSASLELLAGKSANQSVAAGDTPSDEDVSQGTRKLAKELDDFVKKGGAQEEEGPSEPLQDAIATADLQLQTARRLRQLLQGPTNKELLLLAQERNFIPVLLSWLNLHDRPAVQVEALLALTNIAELCAQQSYYQQTHSTQTTSSSSSSSAAAAAVAAAAAQTAAAVKAAGSVPFPPLSFSQTLSQEAMAAFESSLSSSIQSTKGSGSNNNSSSSSTSLGLSGSLSSSLSQSLQSAGLSSSSLPFGLGGSGSGGGGSSSSSSFLPPPTPVSKNGSCFPQQLSASSQHLLLRHADAIPTLISLLSSPNREVYEQAMWILGSIAAGDSSGSGSGGSSSSDSSRDKSVAARDVILAAGIMNQLLRCLEAHPTNLSLQRIGSWTLSNLVEGIFNQPSHGKSGSKASDYSSSDEIEMSTLLPVLRRLLRMSDAEVLSYSCWTLSHLCDGPSSHISAVVTTKDPDAPPGGLVPRLVELLLHASWRVTKPALRTIGNIVCAEGGDDNNSSSSSTDYTDIILECNAVPRLMELVTHGNREIQKEACWTLSNIAAGTVDQIQSVIDSKAIKPLVKLVGDKSTDQEVRSEACWVVLNATSCGSDAQIETLVDEGCVSVLGVLLGEPSMVMMALEGLERVLQVEEAREKERREKNQPASPMLVSASLIEKALEKHNSSAVNKRATKIWKQHFVSCALCNESFSKHRTADASFCEECKCYVCSKCDCKKYHLSYQEELWAATEEKSEAKKNAKKSKNKKKKQKQKKAKQVNAETQAKGGALISSDDSESAGLASSAQPSGKLPPLNELSVGTGKSKGGGSTTSDVSEKKESKRASAEASKKNTAPEKSNQSPSDDEIEAELHRMGEPLDDGEQQQPPIDFVLYLQQTGSIIALAKLMDALEYGDGSGYNDEELDDKELQLIRNLQQQATN